MTTDMSTTNAHTPTHTHIERMAQVLTLTLISNIQVKVANKLSMKYLIFKYTRRIMNLKAEKPKWKWENERVSANAHTVHIVHSTNPEQMSWEEGDRANKQMSRMFGKWREWGWTLGQARARAKARTRTKTMINSYLHSPSDSRGIERETEREATLPGDPKRQMKPKAEDSKLYWNY